MFASASEWKEQSTVDNHPNDLRTARLRLHGLTQDEVRLVMRGDRGALAARIGASVPTNWPGHDLAEALPVIAGGMTARPDDEPWVWVAIEPHAGALIGDLGFHGPLRGMPAVEMGYIILPAYRGQGYATEGAAALMAWAFAQPGVERVILRIEPNNDPSLRVADKLGMRETPSDEPQYRRFERQRPA